MINFRSSLCKIIIPKIYSKVTYYRDIPNLKKYYGRS